MTGPPIHPEALALLRDRIDSIAQLQLLLRLAREPQRAWTTAALSAELSATEYSTGLQLNGLVQRRLAVRSGDAFCFNTTPSLSAAAEELERAYRTYPVAVITLIYSNPNRTLRSFSDAFRFRKEEAGPGVEPGTEPPYQEPKPLGDPPTGGTTDG